MKVLRGVLTFIISFVLVILITSVTITSSIKGIIQEELVGEVAKQAVLTQSEDKEEAQEIVTKIDEIMNYNGTSEMIDAAINEYTEYLDTGDTELSDENVELVINFFKENKENIEKITGEELDMNEIDSQESRSNLRNGFKEAVNEINIPRETPISSIIITYGKFTSQNFKTTMIMIIIGLVLLLALISWSLYKWTKPLGSVLITSGIFVLLVYLLISVGLGLLNSQFESKLDINTKHLLISGILQLVSGIILLVIYSIINKKKIPPVTVNYVTQTVEQVDTVPNETIIQDNNELE